ncbi:MAG: GxxExxY protein [Candidatus Marinimicrobia bacterium]|nr:GxxExxY protein [Candidatus Neomarinimicrobiota bacterium]
MLFKSESYSIIGASLEVHNKLGQGFLEAIYQEALSIEFDLRHIAYQREVALDITYKGYTLNKNYYADFLCYEQIILELKALTAINHEHEAQILNYLKASGYKLGILINFGEPSLKFKRMIL